MRNAKPGHVKDNREHYASVLRAKYINPGFKYGCNPILKVRFGYAKKNNHATFSLGPRSQFGNATTTTGCHRFII